MRSTPLATPLVGRSSSGYGEGRWPSARSHGLPVTRPAVSQHLKVLREAGLVSDRRDGTRRIYRLDPNGVGGLRAYFDAFWEAALAEFKAAAEDNREEER